jgi:hypothetical protein
METVKELLDTQGKTEGWPPKKFNQACRELKAAGWERVMDRPEPITFPPHLVGKTGYPWWRHTRTGREIRGVIHVMRLALAEYQEAVRAEPSPAAARIMKAFEKNPDLAAEVRDLLNRQVTREATT